MNISKHNDKKFKKTILTRHRTWAAKSNPSCFLVNKSSSLPGVPIRIWPLLEEKTKTVKMVF